MSLKMEFDFEKLRFLLTLGMFFLSDNCSRCSAALLHGSLFMSF